MLRIRQSSVRRRRLVMVRCTIAIVAAECLGISAGLASPSGTPITARAATMHACPTDLTSWKTLLGAEWLDCHQVPDLTTTANPYTDRGSLTGMGYPPPGSGTLNSKYSKPTTPAVSGLQLDGYFHDGCNAYQVEPALTDSTGGAFIPGCTPATVGTCITQCHHDAQFVVRIPDDWDGHLLSTGTPGIRDAFASDFILSDYAMEKGWAYVSQDKGNIAANFYQDGCDEIGASCGSSAAWPGACTDTTHPWCAGAAIAEWTYRIRQATRQARILLDAVAANYGLKGVTYSYVSGISNGGYQTRRALETDTATDKLYDGGVDWEGTLFIPSVPAGVQLDQPTTGYNLFTYLPQTLANQPGDTCDPPGGVPCSASAVSALSSVGFNPESQPLWAYHDAIYWGLTQKIYRLEYDPEYTNYTCDGTLVIPCVSPPAEVVPNTDPDANYNYAARVAAVPAIASRIDAAANTGDIQHPLITLQGDQDALLPIKTDSDIYAQMVSLAGHNDIFRFYTVRGGNHVDGQFDDHYGVDSYGNTLLRPTLPCVRNSLDAVSSWVEQGTQPPGSHTIPRDPAASSDTLANTCDLSVPAPNIPEGPPSALLAIALAVMAITAVAMPRRTRSG